MKALAEGQPHTHLELRRTDSFGKRCFEISGKGEPGSVFRGAPSAHSEESLKSTGDKTQEKSGFAPPALPETGKWL